MQILIVGAGALGGYFGARLLAAGRDVTFLVRPRTAGLLAQHGLHVISTTHGNVWIEHPPMVEAEQLHTPFDLVIVSCKAYDLASAMDSFAPAVGPETMILPLLNGMAHMAVLDERFGSEQVLGGSCFISAVREADGTIRHLNNRDTLVYGDRREPCSERMQRVDAALLNAGFTASLRPEILRDMWEKWSFLATLAGVTCLMRASLGDIVAVDARLALNLFDECCAIAASAGYSPSEPFRALHRTILTKPGSDMTASMLRDLEEGAPVESHQILGDLLEHGRLHGIPSPLLQLAYTHVRCYEERSLHPGK